ncbi:hypothetical protein HZC07_00665 [Candidatus Micrarchaeota archaeon]|nr:hypothetical protein [Candidatus Micrarchaeota archaeon]
MDFISNFADNVQSVYLCSGNVVKAIYVPANGSTFYKPDGAIVQCPDSAPTNMGAECVQLSLPNFCSELVCGASADGTFPGQKNSTQNATNETIPVIKNYTREQPEVVQNKTNVPVPQAAPFEFLTDNIALLLVILAIVALWVLFGMFRKSLDE